ncbi:MAG: hypothetical protein ACPHVN_00085 [Luminiphilus sp.]
MSTFALILSVTLMGLPDEGQPLSEAEMQPVTLNMAALEVTTHEQCRIEGERLMATLGPRVVSAEYDCVKVPDGTDY